MQRNRRSKARAPLVAGIGRGRSRRATPRAGTVSVSAMRRLLVIGTNAGIPEQVLMAAVGLSPADLEDPDGHVPLAAEVALWQTFARRIADPGFGVRNGSAFTVRGIGLLGYVVRFSENLRAALARVERYGRIFTEAVQFRLSDTRPQVSITLGHVTLGPGFPYAQDFRLAAVLKASRELTGIDIVPVGVSFTYPQPAATIAHREFFRCPLKFGAPTARIQLRASDLELPLARADERLAGYLDQHAEHTLARMVRGETMRHAIRAAIWSAMGEGSPSLQRVAASLHLPARTLQRRLAAEHSSFQREVEEIRKAMAIAALQDPAVAAGDVAFLLGYSELSTFYRAFKRWTGTTPLRFRAGPT